MQNPNKGKEQALESTVEILNLVLSTYLDLTLQHRFLLLAKKEVVNTKTGEVRLRSLYNSEILTFLEKLSLPTEAHSQTEIDIKSRFPGLPTNWRRSIINTSTGMCKSYLSNLKNWESHQKGNPPKPPSAFNLPTFYKGTYLIELLDIKNQFVRLKVFDGKEWIWKNYPVKLGSKQFSQINDPKWSMQSPTLVPKRTKRGIEWYLHIPLVKKVDVKPIKEQKLNPNLTTLAVDLGLRHLAVVTVRSGGKIVFIKFFRGEEVEAHRLQHLQKVFRKQQASGKTVRGERSNSSLWRHIKATNFSIAHNLTKEIVEIAKKFDVKVIVIEHLHKFHPKRREKRSRKLNRKLTYWLKGQIEEQLRYKAFAEGILVKSVNPAFTSQICNRCGGFGERFSHNSLFRCHYCGYTANADFNASVNLHKVFWEIFPFPRKKKFLLKKPACKGKVAHS
jgi:IS605 OrfB family transposase